MYVNIIYIYIITVVSLKIAAPYQQLETQCRSYVYYFVKYIYI